MDDQKTKVIKDFKEKSILVAREFNATISDVWRCYTEAELLDQWWGPAPWRAETKSMNFTLGGRWLYAMVSPEGEKHWSFMNYKAIDHHKSFDMEDGFCDENGTINMSLPVSPGSIIFTPTEIGTKVEFKIVYSSETALQTMIEMGFEQGITTSLQQLENLLNKKV